MAERNYLQDRGLADQLLGLDSGYKPSGLMGDVSQNLLSTRSTGGVDVDPGGGFFSGLGDMLSNNGLMSSITGLGSTIGNLIGLPSQIDWAKTNTKALKQNIATAQEEQTRRNNNIAGYNNVRFDPSKTA